jgi:hypothetical protein
MTASGDLDVRVRRDRVIVELDDRQYTGEPVDEATLAELEQLRIDVGPKDYGARLFDAVFTGELREAYTLALASKDRHRRVHLDVGASTPALAALRWESLTAKGPPPTYLGHSWRTPFSRRPQESATAPNYKALDEDVLKVLVVVSNPTDLASQGLGLRALDEGALTRMIESAMRPLSDRVHFAFQSSPASVMRIRERLAEEEFHVLHMIGHGAVVNDEPDGCFLLENDDETAAVVGQDELAELVMDLRDLRLVVLASSGDAAPTSDAHQDVLLSLAPKMIEYGVPAVVAMHDVAGGDVGRLFTEKFYSALGRSKTGLVDEAMNRARETIYYKAKDSWDWTVPVLFMSGSGKIVEPITSAEAESPTPLRPAPKLAPVHEPLSARGAEPVVRGGKPIRGGKPATPPADPRRTLTAVLNRLAVTRAEIAQLCGAVQIDIGEIAASTPESSRARLVDIAFARNRSEALERAVRALYAARGPSRQDPRVYDINEARAARGTAG